MKYRYETVNQSGTNKTHLLCTYYHLLVTNFDFANSRSDVYLLQHDIFAGGGDTTATSGRILQRNAF